ncbi:NUDIX hydrolase [Aeromicrobium wangtongii]|uniref:NUDIX hydrolase n=1 Tax=Aeromicrobium wangtongii TaxID=2969247 RepID=A0ABY5M6P3_9ACTN|nr:NUDIX domain-containing protein [Aeromicrobium wangtongii]MCD9199244.1 NUDIX hydrolase [Aeromicrobium wangtongii]UUP12729.1 NUDIX hydrolase [Aeromicrobium wangtongii]
MTVSSSVDQRVSLAVSTVIFALRPHPETGLMTLWLPLVRRIREPYEGQWALPGGPLEADEDLAASARHTLERTTGLAPNYLEQLYAFGNVDRSPDERVVSIVYWALVRQDEVARAVDGENVEWFVADELPPLAFDHTAIVEYALARLRAKITYTPIAHAFLPPEFTLADLRAVHEAVLRTTLDPANFRRQVMATKTLVPTGTCLKGTSHRPPALYRFEAGAPSPSPEEQR